MVILAAQALLRPPASAQPSDAEIRVNPGITYQTIAGWEATAQAGQVDARSFPLYKDALFDLAVNDLGINRLRVEVRSGIENPMDYFSQLLTGKIDERTFNLRRYEIVNDNTDPFKVNLSGFQFSQVDYFVESVVLPMAGRLERRGERLLLNLCYVSFTPTIALHRDQPEEYAEFVLATYLHLRDKYGITPDTWEVILEPDNSGWNGRQIGQAIVASANRLLANGFTPAFIAPSTTSMGHAPQYFDDLSKVPGALQYLTELSYHRYADVSQAYLEEIGRRAARGVRTSMLEHIGSDFESLHQDLKIGQVSAWQQYTLAYPVPRDDGAQYYVIDERDPANPVILVGSRTKFLRQYFRYVRSGAVRVGASTGSTALDPLAFVNGDGSYVVVVKAAAGGGFSVTGLPPGTYGVRYTTNATADVDAGEVAIASGDALRSSIPEAGVATVFAKPMANLAPQRPTDDSPPSTPMPPADVSAGDAGSAP